MERQHFTVAIPAGFEHFASVHVPINVMVPAGVVDPKHIIRFPADERFMRIRINRDGSQSAASSRQPMIFIGDNPASHLTAWETLCFEARQWSMPLDHLLTGMALTAAVTMYEFIPKHRMPGDPSEKHALTLNAVRIESSIPKPKDCETLQQWIADKRAMWEF